MTSNIIFEFANIPISARAFLADALTLYCLVREKVHEKLPKFRS